MITHLNLKVTFGIQTKQITEYMDVDIYPPEGEIRLDLKDILDVILIVTLNVVSKYLATLKY